MNFSSDLFSINNIFVPTRNKVVSSTTIQKKPINIINSNYIIVEQKKFDSIDVVSYDPKKIDAISNKENEEITNKFKHCLKNKQYKKGKSYKKLRVDKWYNFIFEKIKTNINGKNSRFISMFEKELVKYNDYTARNLPYKLPIMKKLYDKPNFDAEFLVKLWEIQDGLDAYTGQKLHILDMLNPFSPSCDRIDSSITYQKGNVVLCCFSTNQSKHKFDIYSEKGINWLNYVTNFNSIKNQEIFDRIKRIQTLSME